MKKLTDLKDDQMLIIEDKNDIFVMTKKEFLEDKKYYKNAVIFAAEERNVRFDAEEVLYDLVDKEAYEMYDGWAENKIFTNKELSKLQKVLDEIFSNPDDVYYFKGERIND